MKTDSINELADKMDNWINQSQGKKVKKMEVVRRLFPKIDKARKEDIGFKDIAMFMKDEGLDIKESVLRAYYHEIKAKGFINKNNKSKFRIIEDDL